jgi:single-stranded-DNA-specific exonuclease
MRNTTWKIKTSNQNKSIMLNNFPIDQDILKILHSRGIVSKKDIINFLDPSLDNIQPSSLLSDMEKKCRSNYRMY